MSSSLAAQLERAKQELLDLTARNRLVNTPLESKRSSRLDIIDERTSDVFRILVEERREMTFQAGAAEDSPAPAAESEDSPRPLVQPLESADDSTLTARHSDRILQTALANELLQVRLLRLFYEARISLAEQGVNSLFLAAGFLEWTEAAPSNKVRYAPLLLIPVELHRRTVNARFRIRSLEEEITANLSLQAKLKADFGLVLPDLPDPLDPEAYFTSVEQVIADQPGWKVHRNRMTVWFFSFAKFLMLRDLDPDVWPPGTGPAEHPLVRGLLGETLTSPPPLLSEDEPLDARLDPRQLCHVLEADSSQAAAIEEVRSGRNLVIQGPPGTGKSQLIANVIAAAVRDGRTVLFVAEKLAALEVVKSRLDRIGLGDLCLELHSRKANRRSVLDDLARTLDLGRPAATATESQAEQLILVRDRLNRYVEQLHRLVEPIGVTPFEMMGRMRRLYQQEITPLPDLTPDKLQWTRLQLQERLGLLRDLAAHLAATGSPKDHLWRGVRRTEPFLPSDLQTCARQWQELRHQVVTFQAEAARLAELLQRQDDPAQRTIASVMAWVRQATHLETQPPLDRRALADTRWQIDRGAINRLLQTGRTLAGARATLRDVVTPAAWQTDVTALRRDLAETGGSFWRWFLPRWWRARGQFKALLQKPLPSGLAAQLQLLDRLSEGQAAERLLADAQAGMETIGKAVFGTFWRGADSDWDQLTKIAEWEAGFAADDPERALLSTLPERIDLPAVRTVCEQIQRQFPSLREQLKRVGDELKLDPQAAFQTQELETIPLHELAQRLLEWAGGTALLNRWILLQKRGQDLRSAGLEPLLPMLDAGELNAHTADRLELTALEAAFRRTLAERDELAGFDGVLQNRRVEEFRKLDQERIRLSRLEVAAAHYERLPGGGDHGELGTIRGEIRKKQQHRSLRRLLAEAGNALQAIKPVCMMSPISVAQFLEPGKLKFDLLVIDEASQVRPVEALGALLRCKQAAIVGDHRQLPPTAFFDRVASGEDETEEPEEATAATNVESILDLCVARNLPQRMLRWHYRSRHHSLIAVSNREFYDNRLYVVPSPASQGGGRGLEFRHVPDGRFKSGVNRREAQAVAEAMIEHARRSPQQSLGVGTFSISQRDAILDELERLRQDHPETEGFFSSADGEPWFVKNLENIQGDERDVILISVGYGPNEQGVLSHQFGPLTHQGGERRLNVLISRARERCVVFCSFPPDQIDLRKTASRGTAALKTFLQYALAGQLPAAASSLQVADSEFEQQVAEAVRAAGFQVDQQVGVAGFFIDIAVRHPDLPETFLLGIECDGATYRSARWARDRDRLRQAVLEDHGWTLHRIWSTDWFQDRDDQLRRLLERLEQLRHSTPEEVESFADTDLPEEEITRELSGEEASEELLTAPPYQEASFSDALMERAIPQLPAEQLAGILVRIVTIEGPVHGDEIARRATTLWGQQKVGARISLAVAAALEWAVRENKLVETDGFYTLPGQADFPLRNRQNVASASLRKPEMLPPQEIDAGLLVFLRDHFGVSREKTIPALARQLGFRASHAALRERLESRIEALIWAERVQDDNGILRVLPAP